MKTIHLIKGEGVFCGQRGYQFADPYPWIWARSSKNPNTQTANQRGR